MKMMIIFGIQVKVTNMSNMFNGCEDLEKLPEFISEWKTSQVQYMS